MAMLDLSLILKKKDGVLDTEVEGLTVLLSIESGEYVEMNLQASAIWNQIDGRSSGKKIAAALFEKFDVDPAVCETETAAFLSTALEDGLLEIVNV